MYVGSNARNLVDLFQSKSFQYMQSWNNMVVLKILLEAVTQFEKYLENNRSLNDIQLIDFRTIYTCKK